MTSRVSFPKLLFETLRRHMAAVLITVLGFFIHIVSFFMNVQNIIGSEYIVEYSSTKPIGSVFPEAIPTEELDYIMRDLLELCSPSLTNGIFAMAIGAYLAFDFLRYMHSKRETDFYDSMPIRRQTWFKTIFISSFSLFFVLSAVVTAIETVIVFGTGFGSLTILQSMLWNLICMIAAFLVTWITTALAMVMTGHSIIAFLGFGVFASYIPLILANLVPLYSGRFFETYVSSDISDMVYYFSPATLVYKMTNAWYDWKLDEHWMYIIGCFIFSIVIGVITYLLFLRRPSETAGRAMAFEKANSTIRFIIVIPLTLYAGLFLEEMATMTSTAWLIFGVIFSALLLHGIMECIFNFDIKAIISKKKQLLVTILFCLAFVFVFWIDLFKYDEYIPDADDVKMIKMESHLLGYADMKWDNERDWLQGDRVKDAIAVVKEMLDAEKPSEEEYYYMDHVTITYTMKNGREIKRAYSYDVSKVSENFSKLYASQDFKDDYCVLYNIDQEKISSIAVYNGVESEKLNLSKEEMNQFIAIYLEEYSALELKQTFTDIINYKLIVEYYNEEGFAVSEEYDIYPSFIKTIDFLKSKGISDFYESDKITLTNLEIYNDKYDGTNAYVSNSEQLNELKKYMIIHDFMNYGYNDEYLYAEVEVRLASGTRYVPVLIKQSDIDKVLNK